MIRTGLTSDAARTRARRGLILIACAIVLSAAISVIELIVRATLEGPRITALAHSAEGLGPGSAVWVAGRAVGRVLSVSFQPPEESDRDGPFESHVIIDAVIDRVAEPILRADATADVRPSDLVAPVVLSVNPGSGSAPPWNFADTLRASGPPIDPETVMALSDSLLQAVRTLEVDATEARDVLGSDQGSLARFREDPGTLAGLQGSLESLEELLQRDLRRSSLVGLATDTLVSAAARRVQGRLATWEAAPQMASAVQNLETTLDALDAVMSRLSAITERLDRGEGTAGRALMDEEVRRQLSALRTAAAGLAEDLGYNPSRWLRVRVF
ncbi:MlaD family protein [Candidatus Palauibacter polyketidifaciens]|uniref:MlaD family protein n=1 Tax=Candidatus Palauibacter polyketidifaciens TaxID=3056740 RepID=UPI00139EE91F|nr:MlaD family protein [Candidatus Palauibacter polyketidifaciens]MDE2720328.1 MlaD family protein [Candidatus Palauibacter polyketidifaciens]MYE35546.1 MCE family protein [Gemmatimonadales bacterium]